MMRNQIFHDFTGLQAELVPLILSFVATVPYEESSLQKSATLTHTFPLVCKQFHWICQHIEDLWMDAFERLVKTKPELWGRATLLFLNSNCSKEEQQQKSYPDSAAHSSMLLERACNVMQEILAGEEIHSKGTLHARLYRHILSNYIRCEMPVFHMLDDMITRDRSVRLHFFEPRYRSLIWDLMEPFPNDFRAGRIPNAENGISDPPNFLFAHRSPLTPGVVACIVHILHCNINPNGTATLEVVPVEHVRIEMIFEKEDRSDHLHFAKVMKMQEDEQDLIEILDIQKKYPSLSLI
mmetsp:Transcript_21758/g.32238  ORF Transcript_21758/g.32238 Transcript_21758/m.32238 type:complete len:295 (+) Transcript_21758:122-1006(+)